MTGRWQFWIDRGGTFTDVVARRPDGTLVVHKLLSVSPHQTEEAPIQGIREVLGLAPGEPIPTAEIEVVKMGTTVTTNALLERRGEPTVLLITQGLGDALRIGDQHRPDLFARQIILPEGLYGRVLEVEERHSATGEVLKPLNLLPLQPLLETAHHDGFRACAVVLLHGDRYPDHEIQVGELARSLGFTQVSLSHQVSPLMKLISRGDTTVVDAYLAPVLHRYRERLAQALEGTQVLFMQSNGGLVQGQFFQGKDSLLSGPAGGVVGAVQTCRRMGCDRLISFDMGGTSTDVAHYDGTDDGTGGGTYERTFDTELAGVRLRVPMLAIETVAAGGGSILGFGDQRYRVGPASAGAYPGPACYRHGGPLTVTDANVMVGKLQPDFFPQVFGPGGNEPLDRTVVQEGFAALAQRVSREMGIDTKPEQVAEGFLAIATLTMANAVQRISLQRGHDITNYTLCCFGGAGGQHACRLAEALAMEQVMIHPYGGVLSAYGMGLADLRILREQAIEAPLTPAFMPTLVAHQRRLAHQVLGELEAQGLGIPQVNLLTQVHVRYAGTDTALVLPWDPDTDGGAIAQTFAALHRHRYGFVMPQKALILGTLTVEGVGTMPLPPAPPLPPRPLGETPRAIATVALYSQDQWHPTPVYRHGDLCPGDTLEGPALIINPTATTVVEPGWWVAVAPQGELLLRRRSPSPPWGTRARSIDVTRPDPVRLEIFHHLLRAIAEQMGTTLQNTASSVNIKERLDFSCAIFDGAGQLVANAPHIPVHLGSMGESVQALIQTLEQRHYRWQAGDCFATNHPYQGGTHLPDITVISAVLDGVTGNPLAYVASRGHHGDIGGITPGSMPPESTTLAEEGILLDHLPLVQGGEFQEDLLRGVLGKGPYPARNPDQNLADLQAQVAANGQGIQALHRLIHHWGLPTMQAYMGHVQDNAAAAVEQVIRRLAQERGRNPHTFTYPLDNGSQIQVTVTLATEPRPTAILDFHGTSPQQPHNFNAPAAITRAVVLYVFRTLVDQEIPLNAGCLRPLQILLPTPSLLHPQFPGAVVAGNVETSQAIANTLYGALGIMAASQGTMNNVTLGNERYQYYETIGGGAGAGPGFGGADAVQTHMTNSRLTDPEVLESRFPVLVESFRIRRGSGGAGAYRGGDGLVRCLRFRESMVVAIVSSHRRVAPFGLAGGKSGTPGQNQIIRRDGRVETLPGVVCLAVEEGDRVVIETPGGGGYGDPGESVEGSRMSAAGDGER